MKCPNCGGDNFRKMGGDFDGTYNVYKCHLCGVPWAEDKEIPGDETGDQD